MLATIATVFFLSANAQQIAEVDVCVYGSTLAGVIAAYTAKKLHKSVVLIEPGKYLGGLTTGSLGYTDIGNKHHVLAGNDFMLNINNPDSPKMVCMGNNLPKNTNLWSSFITLCNTVS